jgi:hypothetical protein
MPEDFGAVGPGVIDVFDEQRQRANVVDVGMRQEDVPHVPLHFQRPGIAQTSRINGDHIVDDIRDRILLRHLFTNGGSKNVDFHKRDVLSGQARKGVLRDEVMLQAGPCNNEWGSNIATSCIPETYLLSNEKTPSQRGGGV